VILALKVVVQNDGDFVDLILLLHLSRLALLDIGLSVCVKIKVLRVVFSFQLLFHCVDRFLMIEVRTMEVVGLCAVLSGHSC